MILIVISLLILLFILYLLINNSIRRNKEQIALAQKEEERIRIQKQKDLKLIFINNRESFYYHYLVLFNKPYSDCIRLPQEITENLICSTKEKKFDIKDLQENQKSKLYERKNDIIEFQKKISLLFQEEDKINREIFEKIIPKCSLSYLRKMGFRLFEHNQRINPTNYLPYKDQHFRRMISMATEHQCPVNLSSLFPHERISKEIIGSIGKFKYAFKKKILENPNEAIRDFKEYNLQVLEYFRKNYPKGYKVLELLYPNFASYTDTVDYESFLKITLALDISDSTNLYLQNYAENFYLIPTDDNIYSLTINTTVNFLLEDLKIPWSPKRLIQLYDKTYIDHIRLETLKDHILKEDYEILLKTCYNNKQSISIDKTQIESFILKLNEIKFGKIVDWIFDAEKTPDEVVVPKPREGRSRFDDKTHFYKYIYYKDGFGRSETVYEYFHCNKFIIIEESEWEYFQEYYNLLGYSVYIMNSSRIFNAITNKDYEANKGDSNIIIFLTIYIDADKRISLFKQFESHSSNEYIIRAMIAFFSLYDYIPNAGVDKLISKHKVFLNDQKEIKRREERKIKEEKQRSYQAHLRIQKLSTYRTGNKNGFNYTYLTDYYPKNKFPDSDLNQKQINDRMYVWRFKDGDFRKAAQNVSDFLKLKYSMAQLREIVLCIIPASSSSKSHRRYYEFCMEVCRQTNMINGYSFISSNLDREAGHLSGKSQDTISNLIFNDYAIRGRKIILFDDIITRGTSFYQATSKLYQSGAVEVEGLFLGKTMSTFVPSSVPPDYFCPFNVSSNSNDCDDLPF